MLTANFELSLHTESSIPRHCNYISFGSCLSFTHSLTFNEFPITHLSSSATHVNRCVYLRMLLLCYYSGRPSPSLTLIEHNRQPNERSGLRRATATTATGHQSYTNLFTKHFLLFIHYLSILFSPPLLVNSADSASFFCMLQPSSLNP